MENAPILKKTCMNCGLQKPLASFLQLGGPEGTTYGAICADCRKAAQKNKEEKEIDDGTTRRTGDSIKAETRVHDAISKKEELKKTQQIYEEIEEDIEEKKIVKEEKKATIASKEKEIRENLKKQPSTSDQNKLIDKQKAVANKEFVDQQLKNEAVKIDEKLKTIDLRDAYIPSQFGSMQKLQGNFLSFKTFLGESANINKNPSGPLSVQAANKEAAKKEAAAKVDKKVLTSYITQSWKPATEKPEEKPAADRPDNKPTRRTS